jgi:DNA-binding MarR family transcriptional regulator
MRYVPLVTPSATSSLPPSLTHWPGYLMSFIAEHAGERFERGLGVEGIRGRHAQVLVVIDAEGSMSQRAIGRRLRIDKSPMVGVVDDLERLGLAERRRSRTDRRVQAIHLTAEGRRVLRERIVPLAEEENERTLGMLDEDERALLQALLLRVAESSARAEDDAD